MRRVSLALLVSLGVHVGFAVAAFGIAAWRGLSFARTVEVVPITLESVKELPLGPPPIAAKPSVAVFAPPPRRPRVATHKTGSLPTENRDGGAPPDAQAAPPPPEVRPITPAPKPGDLQSYGPEGSRLTALLRLDRLRSSPEGRGYIGPVDELLRLMPDRRRLLEGSGLDMYRDFDALLIATPNPFDDAVTFLAVRHHLSDAQLQAALDRGAAVAGRPIQWHEEAGRPVGVRAGAGRDDRLFVLPRQGLAVIAPPAYAQLLLHRADHDGQPGRRSWADLIARIDAEDGALPEEAVFMMTASNLLRARDLAMGGAPALPKVISMVAGTSPTSFLELTSHFAQEADARAWEGEFPVWKQKLLGNPLVLLAGLNPIVSRAQLERDGRAVSLRTTATPEETRRILQMIVNLAQGGFQMR
jgi:hypothetical protein